MSASVGGAQQPPTKHVAWAREQFVALGLSHHARCGRLSPARVLPPPVLADAIGQQWVMSVARTLVVGAQRRRPVYWGDVREGGMLPPGHHRCGDAGEAGSQPGSAMYLVGVSCTLGVVLVRPKFTSEDDDGDGDYGGARCAVLGVAGILGRGEEEDCVVRAWIDGRVDVCDWEHFDACGTASTVFPVVYGPAQIPDDWLFRKNGKWAVLQNDCKRDFAMWPTMSDWTKKETIDSVVKVGWSGERAMLWIDLLEGDEAVVSMLPHNSSKEELWLVDLGVSYKESQISVKQTFPGYVRTRTNPFALHSRKHVLIASIMRWVGNHGNIIELKNLKTRKLLRSGDYHVEKVDPRHFLEWDTKTEAFSLFSTENFERPCRVYINPTKKYCCVNGFLVFLEDTHLDLVDAVSGTWLMRQPLGAPSRYEAMELLLCH